MGAPFESKCSVGQDLRNELSGFDPTSRADSVVDLGGQPDGCVADDAGGDLKRDASFGHVRDGGSSCPMEGAFLEVGCLEPSVPPAKTIAVMNRLAGWSGFCSDSRPDV